MKTRLIVPIAVIAVLALAAVVAILIVKHGARDRILDGPGMVNEDVFDFSGTYLSRVYYWHGASSLGDSTSLELTICPGEEDRPVVTVNYRDLPAVGEKETEKTVHLTSNVIRGVEEIIDRCGMKEWVDLPPAEEFALDAPTTSLTIAYSDGTSVTIGSDDELPEGGYAAIREIREYILRCAGIEG